MTNTFRYITAVFLVAVSLITVAEVLGEEQPRDAVERIRTRCYKILHTALESDNPFIRSAAARAAGESEDPSLIPLIQKAAKDDYPTARLFALQALKKNLPR